MRVLFTAYPEKTLFQPMVPLAWALRAAGHEVRVACQPSFADTVTQAGLTAVPLGHDRAFWRIMSSRPERLASIRENIMAPYDAFDDPEKDTWEYLQPGLTEAVWGWHRVSNFPMLADLVDFVRHWEPDLVVWDQLSFGGAIAAKACGAAHARTLWSVDIFGGVRRKYLKLRAGQPDGAGGDPFADWFDSYGRKYGYQFSEDMTTGHFTIDQLPASLQVETDLHYVRTRYVPYGGPAVVPSWLQAPPERPRVALTMGISATELFHGYHLPLAGVLDALSDMDIELVAIVAEAEQHKLGRVPDNVRLVSYVPLHALAPTCTAAIHHAGFGTLNTFATHAVPQLTLPYHFDEPILAAGLADQGAGLAVPPRQATGENIREGLRRLLDEPAFRRGAAGLRDEIQTLPSPGQIVGELEALTTKHRTR
jgi:glycosyltransferase (activator-dependent family)